MSAESVAACPVPVGFGIAFDPSCEEPTPGTLVGGTPSRLLRLNLRGLEALVELRAGEVRTPAGAALARRLFDAGLAHPIPPASDPDLTVVVPAHDRTDLLADCLRALGTRFPVLVVDDASLDPDAVAKVAADHGARLVRRETNGGPAAARNTGLAHVATELVAFVDSDAIPTADDLAGIAAHLADPAVAAAAPRIVPTPRTRGVRTDVPPEPRSFGGPGEGEAPCALDLGARPARVAPFTRVSYVPSTVLLVRRAAAGGFDESLRYGEDVDLVWRLHAAGHRVRYDPSVVIGHHEPTTWPALLERRYRYGTSAAPLSRRHPGTFVPLALEPFTAAAVGAALMRRPGLVLAFLGAALTDEVLMRRHIELPVADAPRAVAARAARTWRAGGTYAGQVAVPILLAAAVRRPRARLPLAAWLLAEPVAAWLAGRHEGAKPTRVAAHLAEDAAYGAGVLAGCVRERTLSPIKPLIRRTRRRTA
ncbi:MAG: mycofactocin biosynthesis glycosyltransferase MftF [Sporichthyaceae bacterium]